MFKFHLETDPHAYKFHCETNSYTLRSMTNLNKYQQYLPSLLGPTHKLVLRLHRTYHQHQKVWKELNNRRMMKASIIEARSTQVTKSTLGTKGSILPSSFMQRLPFAYIPEDLQNQILSAKLVNIPDKEMPLAGFPHSSFSLFLPHTYPQQEYLSMAVYLDDTPASRCKDVEDCLEIEDMLVTNSYLYGDNDNNDANLVNWDTPPCEGGNVTNPSTSRPLFGRIPPPFNLIPPSNPLFTSSTQPSWLLGCP
jgi:hypothetical protein